MVNCQGNSVTIGNAPGAGSAISGVGALTVTGAGTLVLNVSNSYTGGTMVSSGSTLDVNGTNLTDDGLRISGSQSGVLTVSPACGRDAGQYQAVVSNSLGTATSAVCTGTIGGDTFNAAAGWTGNKPGNAMTNGCLAPMNSSVKLTDGNDGKASSVFLNYPQYVGAFTASFTYQDVGGGGADGCAFVLQNTSSGPTALGAGGSDLGYTGITPSVAVEFHIYSPYGVGMAVNTNGAVGPPYGPPYFTTGSVNLAGGDPIGVSLTYDGTTLSTTLTDRVTHATFATNSVLNIVGTFGANTAYVGSTGADGGVSSTQVITNFQFGSRVCLSVQSSSANSVVLSWPNSAGGFVLQQTPALGFIWTTVSNLPVVAGNNANNHVTIPAQAGAGFYRLATP